MTLILITDDPAMKRRFQTLLVQGGQPDVHLCLDLSEADALIARHRAIKLVVVDFDTPDLGGLKALERFCKNNHDLKTVILMQNSSMVTASQALKVGVCACVPATLSKYELEAVLSLLNGANDVIVLPQKTLRSNEPPQLLSRREQQILALLCDGQPNKEIARTFGIQEVTVKMHMRSVIRKLGARNRTHAAIIALDRGLI